MSWVQIPSGPSSNSAVRSFAVSMRKLTTREFRRQEYNTKMEHELLEEIEKAKKYLIIVEGKKDLQSLKEIGFSKIFVINKTGKSLGEKIEEIRAIIGKEKVCILTDFDKKGKKLYLLLKSKLQEIGVKQDNTLRGFLLKEKISHIEGLSSYLNNKI